MLHFEKDVNDCTGNINLAHTRIFEWKRDKYKWELDQELGNCFQNQ